LWVADSIFIVPDTGPFIAISTDTGKTWKKKVVKGLRTYPVNMVADEKTLAIATNYEVVICPIEDPRDTIGERLYRPLATAPMGILAVRDTTVFVFRTDHSAGTADSANRIWIVRLHADGRSDSVSLPLPRSIPSFFSVVRGAAFGDTVCLYVNCAYLTFFSAIVGDRIVSYTTSDDFRVSPMSSSTAYEYSVSSTSTMEVLNITEGIAFSLDCTVDDSTTGVLERSQVLYRDAGVHPNPTSGLLTVRVGTLTTDGDNALLLELWSVHGELVRVYNIERAAVNTDVEDVTRTIDVSDVAQGTYILMIKDARSASAYTVTVVR
jgi:hypothetical protein